MHKATFLEGTLRLTIQPDGPLLVKAGETGSADPTLPDMEFVRTKHRKPAAGGAMEERENESARPKSAMEHKGRIYIPGPSLKGVVRAQCERICRSLDSSEMQHHKLAARQQLDQQGWKALVERERAQAQQKGEKEPTEQELEKKRIPPDHPVPLADNPLGNGTSYGGLDDMNYSSGRAIEDMKLPLGPERTTIVYRRSSFVSQMFGHTSLAGRVRFADAYGEEVVTEERNGVAIDRIYGSVAVGPFNYETVVAGRFPTRIDFKNLTLAQLALLGLGLRDLAEGRVALGFGKSRGLGRVTVVFDELSLRYPTCQLAGGMLQLLNKRHVCKDTELAGLGAFCANEIYEGYALPKAEDDTVPLPQDLTYVGDRPFSTTPTNNDDQNDLTFGVTLMAKGNDQVRSIWKACMPAWRQEIGV